MTPTPAVSELLLHWEEGFQEGRAVSAEELCRESPHLVAEVARRIEALQEVYRALSTSGTVAGSSGPVERWPCVPGYELLAEVGRGGMGVVYQARQTALKRIVALKLAPDGRGQARFRAEAEAVARLQHPHIVQIHEVAEAGGRPYFCMEFVSGGTLADRLGGTPLLPDQAARLAETLARAMHYAHTQGVIHRDLKPGNVLLTGDGIPKITDFGLAKCLDDDAGRTRHGDVLGTPSYMAPEQAAGRTAVVGPSTDVYGLGALLYEMLTGRPPFRGATALETLEQVKAQEPVPPSRLQPRLPRDLETACLKCLEKDPGRRYASALDLANDLGRFLAGEPIRARPVGPGGRWWRWARRRPYVAGLGAAVFLLLLVLAGGATATVFRLAAAKAEVDGQAALLEQALRRERAERARAQATLRAGLQAVNDSFTRVSDATRDVPGLQPVRKQLLEAALAHFQEFLARWGDEPAVQTEVARAWLRVGVITREIVTETDALEPLAKARALLKDLVARQPGEWDHRRALAEACHVLGIIHGRARQLDEAARYTQEALAELSTVVQKHADSPAVYGALKDLAQVYLYFALLLEERQEIPDALLALDRSAETLRDLAARRPADDTFALPLARTFHVRGLMIWRARRSADSLASFARAIDLLTDLPSQSGKTLAARQMLGNAFNGQGWVLLGLGRLDEAEGSLEKAVRVREQLARENPAVSEYQAEWASTLFNQGALRAEQGRAPDAVALLQRACALYEQVLADNGQVTAYRTSLAQCYVRLAQAHRAVGRPDLAAEVLSKRQRLTTTDRPMNGQGS
jgi:tetratricopeptide (TPR) repeat protein